MSSAERARGRRRFPLEVRAARTPDAPALLWRAGTSAPTASLTYTELEQRTRLAALGLLAHGIASGERVALLIAPGPAYPVALLALLRAGCVAVPLSTRVPADAIPALLGRVGCRRLITGEGTAAFATAGIEVMDPAVFRRSKEQAQTPSTPLSQRGEENDELRQEGSNDDSPCTGENELPPFDPDAPATIVFTSGSTGIPKAALHSFASHWASAVGANRNLPLRPGDRWLLSLPLWHVGGLAVIFRCIQGGAAVAIPGRDEPLAETIRALGVTHLSLVATQLRRLLADARGRGALRSLKGVLLGGGPLPAPLLDEAAAAGARLVTSYGSTETSSQATATRPDDPPAALRTAGRPLP
ncbi:MAG TPA: AMP-binding protein, partial [Candidatus Methanoperedens sp.]|nr:AMP-binding protein [Candidatus Methanoperedens sp.]